MKLVNRNVEWATPKSRRSPEILARMGQHEPEIICLTETHIELLGDYGHHGHMVWSRPDYGHVVREERRKVLLWSKRQWRAVDDVGCEALPPGRFVAGVTETSLGEVTVMGICIPWAGSRASGPNTKRRRWEDHAKYLEVLGDVIDRASSRNLIVVGDFNQRIDQGSSTPVRLRGALERVFAGRLTVATAALGFQGRRSIDHIALSRDLAVGSLGVISNVHGETKLSDHFGVVADLHADVVQG